jgi:hypothetical protein
MPGEGGGGGVGDLRGPFRDKGEEGDPGREPGRPGGGGEGGKGEDLL